jgi:hypothetical protein
MAFYLPVTEHRFESTEYTRGPWDHRMQHAGPPAALLARAVEARSRPDLRVARLAFDILRPVPIAPVEVTSSVRHEGRRIMVVEAAIEPYMRCTAVLIRASRGAAPQIWPGSPQNRLDAQTKPFFAVPHEMGYHTAMEIRFCEGSFVEPGPATAWMRMQVPLVAGEEPSPLARVLVAADSSNGISSVLDIDTYLFVNVDLTVHLFRYPIGEWVCVQAATRIDGDGVGLADAALYDDQGEIGRCAQSLFVDRR